MVSIPPSPYRKRRVWKQDDDATAPTGARVVSVQLLDGTAALWTFSGPVTVTDNVPCPPLRILVEGQWLGAVNIGTWSTDYQVACDYETGELTDGQAWLVAEQPSGIDFSPAVLTLPQTGTTLPPDEAAGRAA